MVEATQADERPPTPDERLANTPMKLIAAALRRVVPHCPYSDDAHVLTRLAEVGDRCGLLGFADFCTLISMPGEGEGQDNAQVGAFFRDLQAKLEDAETQLRKASDDAAQERRRHENEIAEKDRAIANLSAQLNKQQPR